MNSLFIQRYCSIVKKSTTNASHDKSQSFKSNLLTNNFLLHKYVRSFITLLCFAYLQISNNCINYLNCVYVNGTYVMFSSPSINCTSPEYQSLLPFIIVLIVVIVCMLPLLIAFILYRHRDRLSDAVIKSHIGNLYESYHPHAWYWQPIVLVRQVIMIVLFNSFVSDHSTQFLSFVYFNLVVYVAHAYFQPNLHVIENRLEGCSHILLLVISDLLISSPPPYSEWQQILTCVLVVPFALVQFSLIVVSRLKMCRRLSLYLGMINQEKERKAELAIFTTTCPPVSQALPPPEIEFGSDLAPNHVDQHQRSYSYNPITRSPSPYPM